MRWVFVCGISFDLAGAVLIAWTIYSRTPAETLEEARSPLDANLWTVIFREREQAYVRAGLGLLATGFVLQLIGYVAGFHGVSEGIAPFVALAVFAAALIGGRAAVGGIGHVRHAGEKSLPEGIWGERHMFRLATDDDVRRWRALWTKRILRTEIRRRDTVVEPVVNSGRWIFSCPDCVARGEHPAAAVTPSIDTAVCLSCGAEFPAAFPPERAEIERLLVHRPRPNRNWEPGETLEDLRRENLAHNLPV